MTAWLWNIWLAQGRDPKALLGPHLVRICVCACVSRGGWVRPMQVSCTQSQNHCNKSRFKKIDFGTSWVRGTRGYATGVCVCVCACVCVLWVCALWVCVEKREKERGGERERERVGERGRESVCVCVGVYVLWVCVEKKERERERGGRERERERGRESVCVCGCCECVCLCVWKRERKREMGEREGESVCGCVWVCDVSVL